MKNTELKNRMIQFLAHINMGQSAFEEKVGISNGYVNNMGKSIGSGILGKITTVYPELNTTWLTTGIGNMLLELDSYSAPIVTKNGYEHMQIGENLYMMKVPLLNIPAQAGFADNYQDVEYLSNISAFHSIIVNEVHKGRYFAFVVRNDSMDCGTSEAITPNSIVTARELIREHWSDKLWYTKRPYWIIATRESSYPLLKQIIAHDTERGIITCHSLNGAPEYQDFELSMNDITGLFYAVDITRKIQF